MQQRAMLYRDEQHGGSCRASCGHRCLGAASLLSPASAALFPDVAKILRVSFLALSS